MCVKKLGLLSHLLLVHLLRLFRGLRPQLRLFLHDQLADFLLLLLLRLDLVVDLLDLLGDELEALGDLRGASRLDAVRNGSNSKKKPLSWK